MSPAQPSARTKEEKETMKLTRRHLWIVGVLVLLTMVGFAACSRGQNADARSCRR